MRTLTLACALSLCAGLSAQSPLTTLFLYNNYNSAGGTVMFDLNVTIPVTVGQIDLNCSPLSVVSGTGTLEVRLCPITSVGNETNPAVWTSVSIGNSFTIAAPDTPSPCTLSTPVVLTPGTYGVMLVSDPNWSHAYTNGTGTNQSYSTSEMTINLGTAANTQYGAPFNPRVANISLHYTTGSGAFATKTLFGTGCYDTSRSIYEFMASPTAHDLGGLAMTMTYLGQQYLGLPVGAFVAPSPAAVTLGLGDDTETPVTLSTPFPYVGGVTSTLIVCSNGFVSVASGNGVAYTPSNTAWLSFPFPAWGNWHDFNVALGGAIKYEEVGTVSYVTWENVPDYGFPASANTWQLQFDRANGGVTFAWGAMSLGGNSHLIGYTAGGSPSRDRGSQDLSALIPMTFLTGIADSTPIRNDASARPVLGTTINLVTTNIPANATMAFQVVGLTQFNPAIELSAFGMPGCFQYCDLANLIPVVPVNGTASIPVTVPGAAGLAGLNAFGQAAAQVPGANTAGIVSSNAIRFVLNPN